MDGVCRGAYSWEWHRSLDGFQNSQTLVSYPSHIFAGNLGFNFSLDTENNVEYEVSDMSGKTLKREQLGTLAKGDYTFKTKLNNLKTKLLLLKLHMGDKIETTNIFTYE